MEAVESLGFLGAFTGGVQLPQPELEQQYFFGYIAALCANHRIKDKKQMRVGIIPTSHCFYRLLDRAI